MRPIAITAALLTTFFILAAARAATPSEKANAWLEHAPGDAKEFTRKLSRFDKFMNQAAAREETSRKPYLFDVDTLHEIAKKGVGLSYEQMFKVVHDELLKRYPGHLAETRRWIFNVAGGAMGQLTVLYCSPREYLIFFGTPIGTEGFSGRFKQADVYDFTIDGEMQTYAEGEFTRHVFGPGSAAKLARGTGKGYKIPDHAWMLEYMRGNIIPSLNFGIWAPTVNVTLDWHSAWNQIHDCGKIALKEIFEPGRRGD
ncbi:MAG: hypothetical protein HY075_12220 [Deltaproteobacteria bacterium]|nr:hypothetical protein [Deltaproteobacteria bacterium]